jgi:hydrogenase expression/formation protein HypC
MCLAVPGEIKDIDKGYAVVDFGGIRKRISLGIMTDVKKGDHVLVHAGFAIGKVSAVEAEDTRKALKELHQAIQHENN